MPAEHEGGDILDRDLELARQEIAEARRIEDSWSTARAAGTAAAIEGFLATHATLPGPIRTDADRRLRAARDDESFAQARTTGNPERYLK